MMAETFYRLHCREKIAPHFSAAEKLKICGRISELTLRAPIWLDRETDFAAQFPELKPHINTKLSGTYLVAIYKELFEAFQRSGGGDTFI